MYTRSILTFLIFVTALPVKGSSYTHNDHLGSASWITDNGTKPVQYLHYLPYGQLLANHTYLKYTIFFSAKVAN